MKQQIVVIGGGETFESTQAYLSMLRTRTIDIDRLRPRTDWKHRLQNQLGEEYDVLTPRMPNVTNAQYDEWALWFSRIVPQLCNNSILIGHSLGALFLVRYLGEHPLPCVVTMTILIAPPYTDTPDESLASFRLPKPSQTVFAQFEAQAGTVHIVHSTDDSVVPYGDALCYQNALPSATLHTFQDRKHFNEEHFPELAETIRSVV